MGLVEAFREGLQMAPGGRVEKRISGVFL